MCPSPYLLSARTTVFTRPNHADITARLVIEASRVLYHCEHGEAIARLDTGEYGLCFECGGEIAVRRLRALPFAVRCRAYEEAREQEQTRREKCLAKRVGFSGRNSRKPNEYRPFRRNARDVNDLASSNVCWRSRPLASVCRFCHRNVTQHVTRREVLRELPANISHLSVFETFRRPQARVLAIPTPFRTRSRRDRGFRRSTLVDALPPGESGQSFPSERPSATGRPTPSVARYRESR